MRHWLRAGLTAAVNLIFPFLRQTAVSAGAEWRRFGRGLLILLHILVLIAILVALYWLDYKFFHIWKLVDVQGPLSHLRYYWLPILFLFLYSFGWLSWWVWELLFPKPETGAFPEIDQAWERARATLASAYVSLHSLPLFLILGTPEDEERSLFHGRQLEVAPPPDAADAPLRIYATRDALFLTCPGASALGCYARSLVGKVTGQRPQEQAAGDDDEILQTLSPRSKGRLDPQRAVEKMASVLIQAEREGRPLTKAEKRELRCIYRQDNQQRSVVKQPDLIDDQVARLAYLCRLVVRDRSPYCPVNGILLALPFAGLDSEADASDVGVVVQRDLAAAIAVLRVHCPLYALVCDWETAPGFDDFVKQFSARERLRRIGQRCHLVTEFPPAAREENAEPAPARMARSLADQVCDSVVKNWIAMKFQLEDAAGELEAVAACNSRLFLFFDELQQRNKRLGNILAGAVVTERDPNRLLFGGCYLAGTGGDPATEQAFVKGVLDRLIESENCVYWTDSAWAEEAGYQRWLAWGWPALVLVALAALGVIALAWRA
jgi:hypothetical protein